MKIGWANKHYHIFLTFCITFFLQLTLFLFYPSGRYEKVKQEYIYTDDDFIADIGGYLVRLLEINCVFTSSIFSQIRDSVSA